MRIPHDLFNFCQMNAQVDYIQILSFVYNDLAATRRPAK